MVDGLGVSADLVSDLVRGQCYVCMSPSED